ncbi:MAG: hypothetical protein NVS9B1_19130 [Candidatus Dormibacteraceae bacterium]
MRRIVIAGVALTAGLLAAGALLAYHGGGTRQVYVVARDLAAGSVVGAGSLRLVPVSLAPAQLDFTFQPGQERALFGARAIHSLAAGQVLQRGDIGTGADAGFGLTQVLVPVHDAPPLRPGDRIALLAVAGAGERTVVTPYATGITVAAVTDRGLVLAVRAQKAPSLVFAASALRLAVVLLDRDGPAAELAPINGAEQALAEARR